MKGSRQSLKHRKSNPAVPAELDCLVYLPGIGSVVDFEWLEPQANAPASLRTEKVSAHDLAALQHARAILTKQQETESLLAEILERERRTP